MTDEKSEIKDTDTTEASTEPTKPKAEPWLPILMSHSSFLDDLECIGEMVALVLPVLKKKDEQREQRLKQLTEEISSKRGKRSSSTSAMSIIEISGHLSKILRGDHMFRQGVITSIVSKFDEFVIDVLKVSYRHNTGWLKNPDKKISYKELLEITSFDLLKDEIISKEIDGLMRDSHHAQITFLDSKLKLGIAREFPSWLNFLEITERRNLFVHTGGIISSQYLDNCNRWNIPIDERIVEGGSITASDDYIQQAIDCFYELSFRVAQASVRRIFPTSVDNADIRLNIRAVDLLSDERWDLAERVFDFALNIPEDLCSQGEKKYYFLVNRCIAKKFAGKSFKKDLHSIDWSPFHPKYHFAVAILEDRFDDAAKLMKSKVVYEEIGEYGFKTWPLLREFRNSELFLNAFNDIFGKDYNEELLVEAEREIKAQFKAGYSTPSTEASVSNLDSTITTLITPPLPPNQSPTTPPAPASAPSTPTSPNPPAPHTKVPSQIDQPSPPQSPQHPPDQQPQNNHNSA